MESMTEIYLPRHPETTHNVNHAIVSGRSNHIELTPKGVEQAKRFAHAFAKDFPEPTVLMSSPAIRARRLLDIYLEETGRTIDYTVDDALQEMSQGVADGQLRADIYTEEVLARIDKELFDFKHPEGESLNDVSARMIDWLWRMHREHNGETILAATHGQAIRRTVGHVLGWNHFQTTRDPLHQTPNVSVTHLSVADDGIKVHYMGKEIIEPVADEVY